MLTGQTVPKLPALRRLRLQPLLAFLLVLLVPPVEAAARHVQLGQGAPDRQGRVFDQVDDLPFLRFGWGAAHHLSHGGSLPSKLYWRTRFFSESSATSCFSCSTSARISFTCRLSAWRSLSPTSRCFPASRKSLLHR